MYLPFLFVTYNNKFGKSSKNIRPCTENTCFPRNKNYSKIAHNCRH